MIAQEIVYGSAQELSNTTNELIKLVEKEKEEREGSTIFTLNEPISDNAVPSEITEAKPVKAFV